jgi:hypothetical protein
MIIDLRDLVKFKLGSVCKSIIVNGEVCHLHESISLSKDQKQVWSVVSSAQGLLYL